jgi:hypothetical protein
MDAGRQDRLFRRRLLALPGLDGAEQPRLACQRPASLGEQPAAADGAQSSFYQWYQ